RTTRRIRTGGPSVVTRRSTGLDNYSIPGKVPHCSDRGLNSPGGRERFETAVSAVAHRLAPRNTTPTGCMPR
ncbi:hypothetical protein RFN62_19325, partial [Rhodococcus erythropolis]